METFSLKSVKLFLDFFLVLSNQGTFVMELVKNRASGNPFIVLEDAGGDHFLLITPEGKIKSLERRLFDPPLWVGPQILRTEHDLTRSQVTKYEERIAE